MKVTKSLRLKSNDYHILAPYYIRTVYTCTLPHKLKSMGVYKLRMCNRDCDETRFFQN